ncbi:MAG TPA: response regulator transcription factor [Ktedonobacterales bacterium]
MNMSHAYSIPMPVSSPTTRRSEASSTGISGTTPAANPHAAQVLTAALRRGATAELAARGTSPFSLPEAQVSGSHLVPPAIPHAQHTAQAEAQRQAAEPIRVLQVDDHVVMGNGIRFSLLAFPDIEVIAQATSGEEGLALCEQLHPDVVLMDLIMPGMGGVAAITVLHAQWPEVQVIALTSFEEGSLVEEALRAGAIGYLLKDVDVDELGKAIRLARRGIPILAPMAAQALVHAVAARPPKIGQDLTDREREVLGLLAEGLSNQQIAERLVITPATVKFHTRSIRSKLGTSSRTETVVLALQHHLV